MDWKFYFLDDCVYPECKSLPPYPGRVPPFGENRYSRGVTYTDYQYRGGAQREQYIDECIPVFPGTSGKYKWPCDFINIMDEGKGFLISKPEGRPPYWPECCKMGEPFKPPLHDFTKQFNYGGEKEIDGKAYHEFDLNIPPSGGPFYYNFWDGREEYNGRGYHVPQSFNMLGQGANGDKIWMN